MAGSRNITVTSYRRWRDVIKLAEVIVFPRFGAKSVDSLPTGVRQHRPRGKQARILARRTLDGDNAPAN